MFLGVHHNHVFVICGMPMPQFSKIHGIWRICGSARDLEIVLCGHVFYGVYGIGLLNDVNARIHGSGIKLKHIIREF